MPRYQHATIPACQHLGLDVMLARPWCNMVISSKSLPNIIVDIISLLQFHVAINLIENLLLIYLKRGSCSFYPVLLTVLNLAAMPIWLRCIPLEKKNDPLFVHLYRIWKLPTWDGHKCDIISRLVRARCNSVHSPLSSIGIWTSTRSSHPSTVLTRCCWTSVSEYEGVSRRCMIAAKLTNFLAIDTETWNGERTELKVHILGVFCGTRMKILLA